MTADVHAWSSARRTRAGKRDGGNSFGGSIVTSNTDTARAASHPCTNSAPVSLVKTLPICPLQTKLGLFDHVLLGHYNDVIMSTMASQITSLAIVYSAVFFYSGADQRKHQSSASLAFVRGIHRGPVNSLHKRPVTRKMLTFDDVIMKFAIWWIGQKRKLANFGIAFYWSLFHGVWLMRRRHRFK